MADGNLPVESNARQGGILDRFGGALSDAIFPNIRKNIDTALGRVIGASGEFCATAIENETDKMRARKEGRVDSIRSIDKAANTKNLTDEDLISRAANYHARRTLRQQKNREAICGAAAEEITYNPPKGDAQGKIDDDWLEQFALHAEQVSSDQMQRLWSKILAGEIKQPGRFNFRTMDFVSKLTQDEALLIANVLPFAENSGYIFLPEKLQDTHLDDLLVLEEMGLVSTVSGVGGLHQNFKMNGPQSEYIVLRFKEIAVVAYKNEKAGDLRFPVLRFSSTMVSLMSLCDYQPNRDHIKKVIAHIQNTRLNIQTGYAIDVSSNECRFIQAEI
jgi:hypothetical protein